MAVASLNRMAVPTGGALGTDQSPNNQGLLMPKLKYRFRVEFQNFGPLNNSVPVTELTKQVISFTRPTVNFPEIEVPVYNSTIYLAGKYNWEAVTCEVRDDAGGNISRLIGQQIQKQMDFNEQASAASGIDYKFLTKFQILDGGNGQFTPNVLETWELYGCYLSTINYNDLNYGESAAATISMTIRFDNALQTPLETGGIGINVGRTLGDVVTGVGS